MSDIEVVQNPFDTAPAASRSVAEGTGARAAQARQSAEVMALAMMAHRFPRNVIQACDWQGRKGRPGGPAAAGPLRAGALSDAARLPVTPLRWAPDTPLVGHLADKAGGITMARL
jgi:hypothetical protein